MKGFKKLFLMFNLIIFITSVNVLADDSSSIVNVAKKYVFTISGSTGYVDRSLGSVVMEVPNAGNGYTRKSRVKLKFKKNIDPSTPYEFVSFRYSYIPSLIGFERQGASPYDSRGSILKYSSPGRYVNVNSTYIDWSGATRNLDIEVKLDNEDGTPLELIKGSDLFDSGDVNNVRYVNFPNRSIDPNELIASRKMDFNLVDTYEYNYIFSYQIPLDVIYQAEGYSYANYSVGRAETTLSGMVEVSLTKPNDYKICKGETIMLDTTVSSTDVDKSEAEWYGTFQFKKKGINKWVDINPKFMENLEKKTNPSYSFKPNSSYNEALFRYKYVHKRDKNVIIYSNASKLKILPTNECKVDKKKMKK
ncbi:hypothetical protein OKW22_000111 [Bacilli bacterium PM5-3]|nr:hypothetical protein [Bacilli bacterium PM5-3]